MKIKYLLSILINIIFLISLVNAQTVSHPASQVTPGTFGTGDFTFIGDVTIDNTAFSKLIIDSGPSGYSSVDFYDSGAPDWGLGKDSSGNFYIDQSGVTPPYITILPGGNVGIGTTNPGTKLDVVGGHIRTDNSLLGGVGNVGFAGIGFGSDTNTGLWRPGADQLGFITGGVDRIRIDSSGNVGIGTANPSDKLTVNSILRLTGGINNEFIKTSADSGYEWWNGDFTDSLGSWQLVHRKISDGTWTAPLTVLTGGNVGIGSVSPGEKLDVAGNIKASGTICDGVGNCIGSGSLWTDTGTNTYLTQTTDKVGIGTSTPGTKIHVVGNANTLRVEGTDHTYIEFYPDGPLTRKAYLGFPDAASNDIRLKNEIAAGHIILEPGANVGIGALIPTQKLHVVGNARITGLISCNTIDTDASGNLACGIDTGIISETDPTVLASVKDGVSWAELIGIPAGFADNIDNTGDNDWTISGTNMYSGVSGNVGIGTTGPGAKLEIEIGAGTAGFDKGIVIHSGDFTYTAGHGNMLQFENEDVIMAGIRGIRGGGWASGLQFFTHSSGAGNTYGTTFLERMRIDTNGNVGIGTTNPNYPLTVNGPVVAGPGALAGPAYMFYPTTTYGATGMYAPAANTVGFVTGASERVRIDSAGNVGIGTTSPVAQSKLTITGSLSFPLSSSDSDFNSGGNRGVIDTAGADGSRVLRIGMIAGGGSATKGIEMLSPVYFPGSGIWSSSGNVGIGTTGPGDRLHVANGLLRIERAETDAQSFIRFFEGATERARIGLDASNQLALMAGAGDAPALSVTSAGNVGIGTQSPNAELDVSGNIKAGTASGIGSFLFNSFGNPDNSDDLKGADESSSDVYIEDDLEVDGTMYLTSGYGAIVNSDIAEVLLTLKGRENALCAADPECLAKRQDELDNYERELDFGDMVCINPDKANTIKRCTEPNSQLAVGFVSNTSVLNMGNNLKFGYPVAVAGVVFAKVTNVNGNINPGDLLVSAERNGYAMKNNNPKDGTVVGKAFDFCHEEECEILVFVALS